MKLLASLVVALALGASASAAILAKPSVHVVSGVSSVAVSGQGFKAGERISVLVFHSGVRISRRVSAAANGTFRLHVPVGAVNECTMSYVSAKGDKGSRAIFRRVPPPCGPPITP